MELLCSTWGGQREEMRTEEQQALKHESHSRLGQDAINEVVLTPLTSRAQIGVVLNCFMYS